MMTETISANEIEQRKSDGWRIVKENFIAGKLRTAVMEKEGNPTAWLNENARIKAERRASLSKAQRRIVNHRDYLRHRGYDL